MPVGLRAPAWHSGSLEELQDAELMRKPQAMNQDLCTFGCLGERHQCPVPVSQKSKNAHGDSFWPRGCLTGYVSAALPGEVSPCSPEARTSPAFPASCCTTPCCKGSRLPTHCKVEKPCNPCPLPSAPSTCLATPHPSAGCGLPGRHQVGAQILGCGALRTKSKSFTSRGGP